jgi:hypothetical protein
MLERGLHPPLDTVEAIVYNALRIRRHYLP